MTPSIVPQNRLKHLLREGRSAIGTMLVEIRQASVMQVLSNAGLDFVIIDNEHGAFTIETISSLCRAARQVGVTPIVRVPEWSVRSHYPASGFRCAGYHGASYHGTGSGQGNPPDDEISSVGKRGAS